jgi:flagellar biosynthesis protein FliQ
MLGEGHSAGDVEPPAVPPDGPVPPERIQVYLAEYNEHVHNVRDRVQLEQSILNYTVVLMAAMIPASIQIVDHRAFVALFFVPPVFVIMALLALRQDLMITAIAGYVHTCLAPRLRRAAEDDGIFALEDILLRLRRSNDYLPVGFARYAMFGMPGICALVAVPWLKHKFGHEWTRTDSILMATDSVMLIVAAYWVGRRSAARYLNLMSSP